MSPLTRRQDYSMCYSNVTPKSALPPFNDPKADGILRSSDGVYFRVFQVFFSFPLSFVETFSGILQPSEATSAYAETMDGLPVIPVSEDSKTLDSLLRFCYPIKFGENPVLEDFHHVLSVLKAAKKYSIDTIEKTIYRALVDPKILEKDSLRCFAVLCNARMKNECIIVAKYTLREPLIPAPFEEVDMLTSADWLKLLIYHQQCGSIVQKLFSDLSWISDHYQERSVIPWMFSLHHGGSCPYQSRTKSKRQLLQYHIVKWFDDFLETTSLALRDRPCAETIQNNIEEAIQTAHKTACQSCIREISRGMQEFAVLFKSRLDELIAKVELGLTF